MIMSVVGVNFTSQWLSGIALLCGFVFTYKLRGLRWWLSGKESTSSARVPGLIPGSERAPGVGEGSPLQYSCLRHPMDRGAWRATIHGVTKNQTQLSD